MSPDVGNRKCPFGRHTISKQPIARGADAHCACGLYGSVRGLIPVQLPTKVRSRTVLIIHRLVFDPATYESFAFFWRFASTRLLAYTASRTAAKTCIKASEEASKIKICRGAFCSHQSKSPLIHVCGWLRGLQVPCCAIRIIDCSRCWHVMQSHVLVETIVVTRL